jgi:nitrate/TMAO reductase-like tetraheme cytochrome c subunit
MKFIEWLKKLWRLTVDFYRADKKRFYIIAGTLFLLFCLFSYFAVELTSTPAFCASCHEMKPAYDTWKLSTHYNVEKGKKQATCRDCHVPPWTKPVHVLWIKAYHGMKDVYKHFTDGEEIHTAGYHDNMRFHAPHGMDNSSCLACHADIYKKTYDGYDNIHKALRFNSASKCAVCHSGMVHMQKGYVPYYASATETAE